MKAAPAIALKRQKWKWLAVIAILASFPLLTSFTPKNALKRIQQTGVITILTRNNANCYYTYRDSPMGFEYDLAKAFSEYLGVQIKILTPSWEGLIDHLNRGTGDVIAASFTITPSREKLVDFSDEYFTIQQQVIIHKNNTKIAELGDLQGKVIHVRKGTSYEERLNELKDEGLDITIELHDDTPTEELIRMVAEEEIELTVADSNIALLNRRYYPHITIAFPIEEPESLAWAVRKGERALLKKLNAFFKKIRKDGSFAKIYEKYYAGVEIFDYVDLIKYHQRIKTRLPKYEAHIKRAAKAYGFDWRLIAAVVYQESHFNPRAKSHTGVKGMMQLTLDTARELGITNRLDPEQSIMGGVKYLKKLYERHKSAKGPDRLLIALASYNIGYAHVLDAQAIAEKQGLDPNTWATLKKMLPLLRFPEYYKDAKAGYCRGTEPVRYVKRILTYYDILKRDVIS
jgi:membrane-bound lytic murein transglycosylase F